MKTDKRKQVVGLDRVEQIANSKLRKKCAGASMIVGCVMVVFIAAGPVIWWIGLSLSLGTYGYFYWNYSDDIDKDIDRWIDNMLVVTNSVDDGEKNNMTNHPIKESQSVLVKSNSQEGEQVFEVEITWDQLIEVIEAGNSSDVLTRSDLTHEVWPNLDRDWRDKVIQNKLMRLGLIGLRNTFRWEWGGQSLGSVPEVETDSDTGIGVGGSE